jgi:hypothetical protein
MGNKSSLHMRGLGCALLLICAGLISACGPTATPQQDADEKKWQASGVRSYTITVLDARSIWHAQINKVTVSDGKVTASSATCVVAPAETQGCKTTAFNPEEYTVTGLFARARAQLNSDQVKWTKINYDSAYGYPTSITYNNPKIIDGDWALIVNNFEVQK